MTSASDRFQPACQPPEITFPTPFQRPSNALPTAFQRAADPLPLIPLVQPPGRKLLPDTPPEGWHGQSEGLRRPP